MHLHHLQPDHHDHQMTTFTKEQLDDFRAYKRVQMSNRFNMLSPQARRATGLSEDRYGFVLDNYDGLDAASEAQANPNQE